MRGGETRSMRRINLRLLSISVLLLSLMSAGAYLAVVRLRTLDRYARFDTIQEMQNTIGLRTGYVDRDLFERRGDATILSHRTIVLDALEPDLTEQERAYRSARVGKAVTEMLQTYGQYSGGLFDTNLRAIWASGPIRHEAEDEGAMRQALASRKPVFTDIHIEPDDDIVYGLAVPVILPDDPSQAVRGVVYLERSLRMLLEGQLTPWPSPHKSLRLSWMSQRQNSAVRIDLSGRSGDGAFERYRFTASPQSASPSLQHALETLGAEALTTHGPTGNNVILVAGPKNGLGWTLVAEIDESDLTAPTRSVAAILVSAAIALVAIGLALGAHLYWRQRSRQLLKEAELLEPYFSSIQTMTDGFIRLTDRLRIDELNDAAVEITGYARDWLLETSIEALSAPGSRSIGALLEANTRVGRERLRLKWRRRDGALIDIDSSVTFVSGPTGGHHYMVFRDVTAELAARRRLERLNSLHHLIQQEQELLQHDLEPRTLLARIGSFAVDDPHIVLVLTSWADATSGRVEILTAKGPAAPYADGLVITLDPALPTTNGPMGRALLDGKAFVANDILADPRMTPWRDRAAENGVRSTIAIPVRLGGQVVGALTFYSDETDYFHGEVGALVEEMARSISIGLDAAQARRITWQLAETIRQSEHRLRSVLAGLPIATLVADRSTGRVSFWNSAFERLFGRPPREDETVEAWIHRLAVDENQRGALLSSVRSEELGRVTSTPEFQLRTDDGQVRSVQGWVSQTDEERIVAWTDLTGFRAQEKALHRREQIFTAIVENAGDVIMLIDSETGRILEFNEAAHTRMGYTRDEFREIRVWDLQAEFEPDEVLRRLARLPKMGSTVVRRKAKRRDGQFLDFRVNVGSIEVEGKRWIVSIWTDITEELPTAEALAQEAEKLKILFDKAAYAIMVCDLEGQVVEVNDGFVAQFGVSHLQALSSQCQDWGVALPETAQVDGWYSGQLPSQVAECVLRRADGVTFDASIIWSVADFPPARLLYCSIVDISARKKAEHELARINAELEQTVAERTAALSAAKAELEAIVDTSPIGIALLEHRVVLRSNPSFERMLGYGPGEMLGMSTRAWYPSDADDKMMGDAAARMLSRKKGAEQLEVRMVRKDGSVVWIRATAHPFSTVAIPAAILAMFEDITAERAASQALIEAKEAAEEANRAKSTFLAVMSHEIRTPLSGVIAMTEVLTQRQMTQEESEEVLAIRDSAISLKALIDDILDFSKIEAGGIQLESVPFSLVDLMDQRCNAVAPIARGLGVELTTYVAPDVPDRIQGDPTRIGQILHNLIGNAVKFSGRMADRRGSVAIRIERASAAPDHIRMSVTDNGIGMSAETVDGLFQPFTQAESSTTRRFGGTGLGLAITKRIVDLLSGTISVASRLGEGSIFTVELPVRAVSDSAIENESRLAGLHCLVVDDGAPRCTPADIATYLEAAGAKVLVVGPDELAETAPDLPVGAAVLIRFATQDGHSGQDGHRSQDGLTDWLTTENEPQLGIPTVTLVRRQAWSALIDGSTTELALGWLRRDMLVQAVAQAAGRVVDSEVSAAESVSAPPPLPGSAIGRKILLVEDDPVNRKAILRLLTILGYEVDTAENGQEGLARWRAGDHDLVLTDLSMPEMDGYQLLDSIRREEGRGRTVPIVALSANAFRTEATKAYERGFDRFLTKPILLKDLGVALADVLSRSRPAGAMPAPAPSTAPPHAGEMVEADVFDADTLSRMVGPDPELQREFLSDYRQSLSELLPVMGNAAAAGDTETLKILAHRLKSSSRWVGALRLGETCAAIERQAAAGALHAVRTLLPTFEGLVTLTIEKIDGWRTVGGESGEAP